MQYRRLGQTGLNVSAIGLGTMTWGEQNSESEAVLAAIEEIHTGQPNPAP